MVQNLLVGNVNFLNRRAILTKLDFDLEAAIGKHQELWKLSFFPKRGFKCSDVQDRKGEGFICEMCGHEELRYVCEVEHPQLIGNLFVGRVCAAYLVLGCEINDLTRKILRGQVGKQDKWVSKGWTENSSGNWWRKCGEYLIAIYEVEGGWQLARARRHTWILCLNHRVFTSANEAKMAAFYSLTEEILSIKIESRS
jgi:hypothetical protein